jgi:hypothetical protein
MNGIKEISDTENKEYISCENNGGWSFVLFKLDGGSQVG